MTRVVLGLVLLAAGAFLLEGCGALYPSAVLHYKLAVDVDVDGVIHHGEGVYRVDFQSQGPLLFSGTPQWLVEVTGEAFPINLGDRGTVFILMYVDSFRRTSPAYRDEHDRRFSSADAGRAAIWSYFNFTVNDLPNGWASKTKIVAFANSETKENMPVTALPLMVRFRDAGDPRTIERVDPNNVAASVGGHAKIVLVMASITNSNTTIGIENYLKWLPSLRGSIVNDLSIPVGNLLRIDSGAFRQGNPS